MIRVLLIFATSVLLHFQSTNGQEVEINLILPPSIIPEGQFFNACVNISEAPTDGDLTVTITSNIEDIEEVDETLIFPNGTQELEQCINNIMILLDNLLEGLEAPDEVFNLTVTAPSGTRSFLGGRLVINEASVISSSLVQTEYRFIENQMSEVCVTINGSVTVSGGNNRVTITTTPGTATTPADYSAASINLMFSSLTVNQTECSPIDLRDDTEMEGAENFTISLEAAATLILDPERSNAVVTIIDDDADCGPPPVGEELIVTLNGPFAVNQSGVTVANEGANAIYTCIDTTMILTGVAELMCDSNLTWSPPEPPTCEAPLTPTAAPTAAPTIDMGGLSNDDDDDEVRNILIGVAAGIVGAVILVSFLIILAWIVLRKRKKYDVKYDTSYTLGNRALNNPYGSVTPATAPSQPQTEESSRATHL